jgi:hypothetical protein
MSYLDRPRINFAGTFQASPATINNTPNNYNPANYNENSLKPENIELYWEPKGNSIFNLNNCSVTTLEAPGGASDSLLGSSVTALYTSSPPKLVDLDPMQQNGSEIWGFTVMIGAFGGAYVQGTFTPIAFNGIWINAQGPNRPGSSASGSAVYQSTLTNLKWNVGSSAVLQALQAISPNRLSIRMVVSAHNNAPQLYAFTQATFQTMKGNGVPQSVLDQITSLQDYVMNLKPNGDPAGPGRGYIPTVEYVNALLAQLLGQSAAQQYGPTITAIVGSIGPCLDGEPTYAVPARTLAPPKGSPAWWAPAWLDYESATPSLTLDLANSLPVDMPGDPVWTDKLGTLSLAYYTGSGSTKTYTTIVPSIAYANPDFIDKQSGMLVVTDFGSVDVKSLANLPLAIRSTTASGTQTLLEENSEGLSMRANQFIFRMNPGMKTTPTFPRGETNTVDIYVRKFGRVEGTEGMQIALSTLSPKDAVAYTTNTLETGGTNGINEKNLSTPEGKLLFSSSPVTVSQGKATLTITGTDPGNPRGFVDGQVYFTRYNFSPAVADYNQDPNDLLSTQIYQQTPITGTPTWLNGIGDILRQYGMLYPIMGQFQLWTYEGVVINRDKIQRVLGMDTSQPLHMPVSRDLSTIKCNLILDWFQAGMPYGRIGPVGGPGTSWNNLPTVAGFGPMTGVTVRSGDIIDAIQPLYGSNAAPIQGGPGGLPTTIDLTGDAIVSISGYTGVYFGMAQVAQLTFKTAKGKTYGPFGTMQNTQSLQPFELAAPAGCGIRAFFGTTVVHTNGTTYIASLGGTLQRL